MISIKTIQKALYDPFELQRIQQHLSNTSPSYNNPVDMLHRSWTCTSRTTCLTEEQIASNQSYQTIVSCGESKNQMTWRGKLAEFSFSEITRGTEMFSSITRPCDTPNPVCIQAPHAQNRMHGAYTTRISRVMGG